MKDYLYEAEAQSKTGNKNKIEYLEGIIEYILKSQKEIKNMAEEEQNKWFENVEDNMDLRIDLKNLLFLYKDYAFRLKLKKMD